MKTMRSNILKGCLLKKKTLLNCHSQYVHRRVSVKTNKWAIVCSYMKTPNIYNFKYVERLAWAAETLQI